MDSTTHVQPASVEQTYKDASTGTDQEQVMFRDDARAVQRQKNEAARHLLQTWLQDDTGYDEEVWPIIKQIIENNRLSPRKRFCD